MNRVVFPGALSGQFRAPASKSHAHRLLDNLRRAGTRLRSRLMRYVFRVHILATIDCLNAMGAKITHEGGTISVSPIFANGSPDGACQLYCKESGSTLRFLLPVVGALGLDAVFHMEGRLPERPLHPFDEGLDRTRHAHSSNLCVVSCFRKIAGRQLRAPRQRLVSVSVGTSVRASPSSGKQHAYHYRRAAIGKLPCHDRGRGLKFRHLLFQIAERLYHPRENQACCLPDGLAAEGDWSGAAFFLCAGALSETGIFAPACRKPPARPTGPFWSFCQDSVRRFGRKLAVCLSESPRFTASTLTRAQSRT